MLSDTLRYINLAGLAADLVASRAPMHLCACVSEERGDGEGAGAQALSETLRYINLAGLATGLVALRGPMHLRPTSRLFSRCTCALPLAFFSEVAKPYDLTLSCQSVAECDGRRVFEKPIFVF